MIRIEKQGAVRQLILDLPQQRNALNVAMIEALAAALAAADAAPECRCVVVKGAGEHFCSGRELAPGRARDLVATLAYDDAYAAIFERLRTLTKPSVAVVRGYAVAGGFTLAMACDFVLAEAAAKFGAVEMRNGFPGKRRVFGAPQEVKCRPRVGPCVFLIYFLAPQFPRSHCYVAVTLGPKTFMHFVQERSAKGLYDT